MTSEPSDLLVRLRAALPGLSPSARRAAETILADPAWASASSIEAVAAAGAVSPSTVSRLVRGLGFTAYREFRAALASADSLASADRGGSAEPVPDIDPADSLAEIVAKVGHSDARAVEETTRALDLDQLERAVAAVASARRIAVFGIGASALVAGDLRQKLHRIGLAASLAADSHEAATAAALLDRGDVAIAISHTGTTDEVLVAARLAAGRGATTVALTGAARSPLAAAADLTLVALGRETTFRSGAMSSRIAQLAVVDVLFVAVAARTFASSSEALRRTRAAVDALRATR